YAEKRRTDTVEVLNILRNEKHRRDEELETRRETLEAFRRDHAELAVQVNNADVVTNRFSLLSGELNRTELELLEARARYFRVKKMYDTPSMRPFLLEMAL